MKLLIKTVCVSFLVLWLLPKFAVVHIEPWEIGVRRSLTGGIDEEDFGLGYHLSIPLQHSYYRLPKTVQYLDYTADSAGRGALELRTKENNVIFVDVTLPWRIIDGEGLRIVR